ncbi:hypothetical protein F1188_05010 [Roseospira marina]|uniref:Uncharacterized protein n=1 Tax=Roseospira marina TaxID=140057 RepID=A0A5M6IEK6_9PROT|nr:hypothetical protein [Roseospira marina]KAA5606694.1 hypothetical protein F1188_05010 [Roseospira marina]MBB4313893.1 hypothetical protein [Roseospira marina]
MSSTVWVVTRVIRAPGVPTHFMLEDTDGRNDVRTISEPTLVDPNYYSPVPPDPDATAGGAGGEGVRPSRGASAKDRNERAAVSESGEVNTRSIPQWLDHLDVPWIRMPRPSRAR